MEEFIAIPGSIKIPTMNDCAANVPIENLLTPIWLGFRHGAYVGRESDPRATVSRHRCWTRGSDLGRPNDYITEFVHNGRRSCKVNKEEMVGMMVALQSFFKEDCARIYKGWERTAESMRAAWKNCPPLKRRCLCRRLLTGARTSALAGTDRSIRSQQPRPCRSCVTANHPSNASVPDVTEVARWNLQPGEADIIITRLTGDILTRGV